MVTCPSFVFLLYYSAVSRCNCNRVRLLLMKHQHSSNTLLQGVFSHPYQIYYLIFFRDLTPNVRGAKPNCIFYRAHDDVITLLFQPCLAVSRARTTVWWRSPIFVNIQVQWLNFRKQHHREIRLPTSAESPVYTGVREYQCMLDMN